jgi:hypothetical protein
VSPPVDETLASRVGLRSAFLPAAQVQPAEHAGPITDDPPVAGQDLTRTLVEYTQYYDAYFGREAFQSQAAPP